MLIVVSIILFISIGFKFLLTVSIRIVEGLHARIFRRKIRRSKPAKTFG